jgi:hypothetical protein
MAEAYRCDRCGSRHDGQPNAELVLAEGRGRSRKARFQEHEETFTPYPMEKGVEYDICAACRNDLKEWWAAADDGERSDLVLDDHGSEGDE